MGLPAKQTLSFTFIVVLLLRPSDCEASENTTAGNFSINTTTETQTTTTASRVSETTTAINNTCMNGGSCLNSSNGNCIDCQCLTGFNGEKCENPLIRITGSLTYNVSEADQNFNTNITAFKAELANAYLTYQESVVTIQNDTTLQRLVMQYEVYVEKTQPNAISYLDAARNILLNSNVLNNVFSPSTGIVLTSTNSDINECISQMNNCSAGAHCTNLNPGSFTCACKEGYSGNGYTCTAITCLLSSAPQWPLSSTRTIKRSNGNIIPKSEIQNVLPFGVYIEYTCPKGYMLQAKSNGATQITVIQCVGPRTSTYKKSGWTGSDVECGIKTEFKVAIVAAVVSSAIIILVGGAFIVSCTGKKKLSEDQETLDDETSFN